MARYIDADILLADILDEKSINQTMLAQSALRHFERMVNRTPTADVVPKSKYDLAVSEREANVKGFTEELAKAKSEVERVYYNLLSVLEERAETKQEIAREIFEGIENSSSIIIAGIRHYVICDYELAEIKKKYAEGE